MRNLFWASKLALWLLGVNVLFVLVLVVTYFYPAHAWVPVSAALLFATLSIYSQHKIKRPLQLALQIRDVIKNARDGNFSARIVQVPYMGEIGQVAWELNDIFDQLETYFREVETTFVRVSHEEFGRYAQSGGLTGSFRRSLQQINEAVAQVEQNHQNLVKNRLLSEMQSMNAFYTKADLQTAVQDLDEINQEMAAVANFPAVLNSNPTKAPSPFSTLCMPSN